MVVLDSHVSVCRVVEDPEVEWVCKDHQGRRESRDNVEKKARSDQLE